MRVQDAMCRYTDEALNFLFQTARRVPEDKLRWKPLDNGRTVLDQLQECAQAPIWYAKFLDPSFDHGYGSDREKVKAARAEWDTIGKIEGFAKKHTAILLEKMAAFPDERLLETLEL